MNDSILSIPKVSIIIPVYNTAPYIGEALDSICQQSLRELEIIIINDGSTDNSQQVIERYVQKDKRIQYYFQFNQGQGAARNYGLQLARGKYIYFMDSDDLLDSSTLQQCYDRCEKERLDFVAFDAEIFGNTSSNIPNYNRKDRIASNKIWNGEELLMYELTHSAFSASSCLCFLNHQFMQKSFSGYPAGIIHEDQFFIVEIHLKAQRVAYIPQALFKRRVRPDSTMTNRISMKNIEGYSIVCSKIRDLSVQDPNWNEIIQVYLSQTLNAIIWAGHRLTLSEKIETFFRFHRLSFSSYISFRNWLVFWFKPT